MGKDNKPYPPEQIEWLREYYPSHGMKATQIAFNEHFGLNVTEASIKHRVQKNGIKSNYDGKFKKGGKTWNKGKKLAEDRPDIYEQYISGTRYRFAKGRSPENKKPIGHETKYKDFVIIKVAEPNVWIPRARYVYERTHGVKLTQKEKILHLNGDSYDDSPDNLIKVNDSVLAMLNRKGLITCDKELTRTAVAQQMLIQAIKKLENEE